MTRAVSAFRASRGLSPGVGVDSSVWRELNGGDARDVVILYALTAEDVAGPYVPIPDDTAEKAQLPALGFTSLLEALGERCHASPKLLRDLNPGKSFTTAGEEVFILDTTRPHLPKAASVVVNGTDRSVSALAANGAVLARYPATVGSSHDPLPVGRWKILGVAKHPVFHYNPALFWDADASDQKATLPAGPNNPVGVVWIDLSKPHYGIHGSPEPSTIGTAQSHGCIRLTNWDASDLASAVSPGMPALLKE